MNKKQIKEYRIWKAMKSRCYAPKSTKGNYKKYGINVCDRWMHSFDNFMEDMGQMPSDEYSIDRIDPHGDYTPDNCRWIPMRDQPKNRSNCLFYTHNGQTECLKEWSRILGVNYWTFYKAIKRGKAFDDLYMKYAKES